MSDDFGNIKVSYTPSWVKGHRGPSVGLSTSANQPKKLENFTFRLGGLAACVCGHARKRKQPQEAWNCRPQKPSWTNELWNSQGALSQETNQTKREDKEATYFHVFHLVELAGLCVTLRGWDSVGCLPETTAWPSTRLHSGFCTERSFCFHPLVQPTIITELQVTPRPLSPSLPLAVSAVVSGVPPRCTFSLLYGCKSGLRVGCLWMLIHAV